PLLSHYSHAPHPDLPPFPTRRSSDLSRRSPPAPRSAVGPSGSPPPQARGSPSTRSPTMFRWMSVVPPPIVYAKDCRYGPVHTPSDRKSTRLNSSHVKISYAVFCLTKK